MIKVKVRLLDPFREIAKREEVEFKLKEKSKIHDLLVHLCNLYNLQEKIFDENGKIRGYVIIAKNGKMIQSSSRERIKITSGDKITLFSA